MAADLADVRARVNRAIDELAPIEEAANEMDLAGLRGVCAVLRLVVRNINARLDAARTEVP